MKQIKRNSREFKDVQNLIEEYEKKSSRKNLIRLYATKPDEEKAGKILLNKHKTGKSFYDLVYHSLVEYFHDKKKKLFRDDKKPLYYFKNSMASTIIEMPFEFAGKLGKKLFPLKVV